VEVAFVVAAGLAIVGPPVFATVAWIDDAFGVRMTMASAAFARIALWWTFDDDGAVMTVVVDWAVAVIFTMSDQWARFVVAMWGRHGNAFLAWS